MFFWLSACNILIAVPLFKYVFICLLCFGRKVLGNCIVFWRLLYFLFPQGSVLGPLLFLLFVNDKVDNLIGMARLFADDKKR